VSTQVLHFDTDQAGILTGGAGIGMGWYAFGGGDVMEKEKEFTDRNGGEWICCLFAARAIVFFLLDGFHTYIISCSCLHDVCVFFIFDDCMYMIFHLDIGFDAKLVADRPMRLQTVLDDLEHQMDPKFPVVQSNPERSSKKALEYIHKVHGEEYASLLKNKCEETDRPIRFNPFYARTLIDEHSYDAAVDAVMDWMESVDNVRDMDNDNDNDNHIGAHDDNDHGLDRCGGNKPLFALARPPGHHACQRKGMGGCLFNNSAIAAFYALDSGFKNVAILDFDAHHGNGVAHCVEDEERIRYCSIHEGKEGGNAFIEQKVKEDDPRSQDGNDVGPLGNLLNLNLKAGTGWSNGYKDALINGAVPFLLQDQPDLLIVSAGFDALETDWSSGLTLQPSDYGEIGKVLKDRFGNKVSMGLEGGYSFQDHALSEAIMAFCSAWDD